MVWKEGWNVRGGLSFSHIYDPLADRDASDQAWYQGAIPLRGQLVLHRPLEAQAQAPTAPIAGLAEGVLLRGDWRQSARRPRTTAEASPSDGLLTELSRFGVNTAPLSPREAIVFSNSPASEDARGRYDTENKALEAEIARRSRVLERRLAVEVPAVKPHLGQYRTGELPAFPYDGELVKAKIILSHQLEGLWRWQVEGSPPLAHAAAHNRGQRRLWPGRHLPARGQAQGCRPRHQPIQGAGGLMGRPIRLDCPAETRLKPQLFFGRYLVIASVASRNVGIFDIKTGTSGGLITGMPQADLIEDVLLSADRRHLIQLNSDGQFFVHEIATRGVVVSGRFGDGGISL